MPLGQYRRNIVDRPLMLFADTASPLRTALYNAHYLKRALLPLLSALSQNDVASILLRLMSDKKPAFDKLPRAHIASEVRRRAD